MSRLARLGERWQAGFAGRTWARYSAARGPLLAGGIAYFAFFSVIPAVAIGFTVLGFVVGDDSELQRDLVENLNSSFGSTVIGLTPDDEGIVSVDQLVQRGALTVSAVLGFGALVLTGLGWLDATRSGIRAVFDDGGDGGNVVVTKLRDLGVLAMFGVAVVVSAGASVVVTTASNWFLGVLGLSGTPGAGTLVTLASMAVIAAVDSGIFLVLFTGLARVRVPVRHLWQGAVVGGVAMAALKTFGGLLLEQLGGNRFLAAFSVIVGLLVWMNLIGRVTLLAASWAATRAADAGALPAQSAARAAVVVGASAGGVGSMDRSVDSAVPVAVAARAPTYGVRATDRTTLAAGVVLGVLTAVGLRVARGAVRAVVSAVRG
jgi:membrane protein